MIPAAVRTARKSCRRSGVAAIAADMSSSGGRDMLPSLVTRVRGVLTPKLQRDSPGGACTHTRKVGPSSSRTGSNASRHSSPTITMRASQHRIECARLLPRS